VKPSAAEPNSALAALVARSGNWKEPGAWLAVTTMLSCVWALAPAAIDSEPLPGLRVQPAGALPLTLKLSVGQLAELRLRIVSTVTTLLPG
jgi:hypothetical protein